MYKTVSEHDFCERFRKIRPNSFSYAGLRALFNYLEEYEESTGENIELDVIALCCDFAEYDTALEAAEEYGYEPDEDESREDQEEAATEWLNERTTVIPVGDSVILSSF